MPESAESITLASSRNLDVLGICTIRIQFVYEYLISVSEREIYSGHAGNGKVAVPSVLGLPWVHLI